MPPRALKTKIGLFISVSLWLQATSWSFSAQFTHISLCKNQVSSDARSSTRTLLRAGQEDGGGEEASFELDSDTKAIFDTQQTYASLGKEVRSEYLENSYLGISLNGKSWVTVQVAVDAMPKGSAVVCAKGVREAAELAMNLPDDLPYFLTGSPGTVKFKDINCPCVQCSRLIL